MSLWNLGTPLTMPPLCVSRDLVLRRTQMAVERILCRGVIFFLLPSTAKVHLYLAGGGDWVNRAQLQLHNGGTPRKIGARTQTHRAKPTSPTYSCDHEFRFPTICRRPDGRIDEAFGRHNRRVGRGRLKVAWSGPGQYTPLLVSGTSSMSLDTVVATGK